MAPQASLGGSSLCVPLLFRADRAWHCDPERLAAPEARAVSLVAGRARFTDWLTGIDAVVSWVVRCRPPRGRRSVHHAPDLAGRRARGGPPWAARARGGAAGLAGCRRGAHWPRGRRAGHRIAPRYRYPRPGAAGDRRAGDDP